MIQNENFIIFSDVKRVFFRYKWLIAVGALLFGAIGFYVRSQLPLTYEIVATFKQPLTTPGIVRDGVFERVLNSIGVRESHSGCYLITSSKMLMPVVEKLGVQASIAQGSGLSGRLRQIGETIRAERGLTTAVKEGFLFEDVHYLPEESRDFILLFTSKEHFEVRTNGDHLLTEGRVGEPLQFDAVTLTLKKSPSALKVHHAYRLSLNSLHGHILQLREAIEVKAINGDSTLINLTLNHRDRIFGKKLLNTLMAEYQTYLIKENRRVSREQMSYLEERRDEFCAQMDVFLGEHVDYLKESLGETGFLSLGQRLPLMEERKKDLTGQRIKLESEYSDLLTSSPSTVFNEDDEMMGLQRERRAIMKERDELGLALIGAPTPAKYITKLDALNLQEVRIKTGVDTVVPHLHSDLHRRKREQEGLIYALSDFGQTLSPDAHQLTKIQKEKVRVAALLKEKQHVELTASYLKNQLRLLSMQEGILKQRVFHRTTLADEFLGIDIPTLKKLHLNYLHERDESLSKIRKDEFVREQMAKREVEWLSLSSAFPDSISREMALEMGQLLLQMRKRGSYTKKELVRKERTISEKRSDLIKHLNQSLHLQQLQSELTNQRIRLVQSSMVDLLNREMTLIQQQIKDRVADRLLQVRREKEFVSGELRRVTEEMGTIPETWLKERQLQFSSELHKGMLESLVRLVESKNIENNLMIVESKPLDFAYAPLIPIHPKLLLITLLGLLVGLVLTFGGVFIWSFYRGIPLSLENLAARGRAVVGKLSERLSLERGSEDLEVVRTLSLFLREQRCSPLVVTLVLGEGVDYSLFLANLLEKEGRTALVVDLDFSKKSDQGEHPGLIQYLEGDVDEPIVEKSSYGGFIPMGGDSPYGDELLKSKRFHDGIDRVKQHYDLTLLALPKGAKDSLSKSFFSCSDVMVVRLEQEGFSQLLPYFEWDDGEGAVAFLS